MAKRLRDRKSDDPQPQQPKSDQTHITELTDADLDHVSGGFSTNTTWIVWRGGW